MREAQQTRETLFSLYKKNNPPNKTLEVLVISPSGFFVFSRFLCVCWFSRGLGHMSFCRVHVNGVLVRVVLSFSGISQTQAPWRALRILYLGLGTSMPGFDCELSKM